MDKNLKIVEDKFLKCIKNLEERIDITDKAYARAVEIGEEIEILKKKYKPKKDVDLK